MTLCNSKEFLHFGRLLKLTKLCYDRLVNGNCYTAIIQPAFPSQSFKNFHCLLANLNVGSAVTCLKKMENASFMTTDG